MKVDVRQAAAEVWHFVAGDSPFAPVAVAAAVLAALGLERARVPDVWTAFAYAAIVAAGLVAGAFDRR